MNNNPAIKLPNGEKSAFKKRTLILHVEQFDTVESAMSLALRMEPKDPRNDNRYGSAISHICAFYLANKAPELF